MPEGELEPDHQKRRRWWLLILTAMAFVLLTATIAAINFRGESTVTASDSDTTANFADVSAAGSSDTNAAASEDVNAADMNATADANPASEPSDWNYSDTYDQVRGGTIYHASMDSENSANFNFPYGGGSTLSMTVRKHPSYGDDVIFAISKGQFVCHVDKCTGTINFGSGPEDLALSEPTDNSADTLFAADGNYVIERLKKAKRVVVELPFYQEGNRQFVFEMKKPLAWPPKGSETQELVEEPGNSLSDD
jgi:hypothetical protein